MNRILSIKQFVISQILILLFGSGLIAVLYYVLNTDITVRTQIVNYLPVTKKQTALYLEVKNPDDNLLVFENTILISGTTKPNSVVLISTDEKDYGLKAGANGEFSRIIDLRVGLNNIIIYSFDGSGESKQEVRNIYYSKEEL